MRLEHETTSRTLEYARDYKQKVQMRLHMRDYKQSVQMRLEHVRDYKQKVYR